MGLPISIDSQTIKAFCEKWKISEFSLFGSVLQDHFHVDSDIDVLIEFSSSDWDLYDWIDMQDELTRLFRRKVDLVSKQGIRNPFRRYEILNHRKVLYVA